MNRRINRRYQTPLRPDFAHFLIEEQGLSDRQKQADASGFCTIKAYSFQEVKEDQPEDKYLTKAEFKEWLSKVEQNARGGNRHESTTSK